MTVSGKRRKMLAGCLRGWRPILLCPRWFPDLGNFSHNSLFEDNFGRVMIRNIMHSTCAWKPKKPNFRGFSDDCQGGPLESHLAVTLDQVTASPPWLVVNSDSEGAGQGLDNLCLVLFSVLALLQFWERAGTPGRHRFVPEGVGVERAS